MLKTKYQRLKFTAIAIILSVVYAIPVFAQASTLTLDCPEESLETEFTCKLMGHSDTPITTITANFTEKAGVKYISSEPAEDSIFTINANNTNIAIRSTREFSGDFTIGNIEFETTQTEEDVEGQYANNIIELGLVVFSNGENNSFTAIGSTSKVQTPLLPAKEEKPATNQTTNKTESISNETIEQEGKKIPLLLVILIIVAAIAAIVVIILILSKKQKKTPKPQPVPIQPPAIVQRQETPAHIVANPAVPNPAPQVQKPTGVSVENLPFEKASSDNPMSFES